MPPTKGLFYPNAAYIDVLEMPAMVECCREMPKSGMVGGLYVWMKRY